MRKALKATGIMMALVVLSGCWDRVEIEERGFVVGTAIDATDSAAFVLTFQFVLPSAAQSKSPQSGQSGKSFQNLSAEGTTLFKAARKMSNESSRPPYMEHNKIIILSERLAREGRIEEVLDLFIRDHEMRRASKVMVSVGEAKQMLEVNPPIERLPVQYINATSENPDKSESIIPPTTIGHVQRYLLEELSYAIPVVRKTDNKVSLSGAAVFNANNRLQGFLDHEQTTGRNFFTGTIRAGAIEVELEGRPVVFELKKASRKITANVADREHPAFDVHVSAEGNVGESYANRDILKPDALAELEKKVGDKIAAIMESVLVKLQKEYRSDILGFGNYLNENHYAVWKSIRDDWDRNRNLFSRCRVNIRADVKIRIVGAIGKSQL